MVNEETDPSTIAGCRMQNNTARELETNGRRALSFCLSAHLYPGRKGMFVRMTIVYTYIYIHTYTIMPFLAVEADTNQKESERELVTSKAS